MATRLGFDLRIADRVKTWHVCYNGICFFEIRISGFIRAWVFGSFVILLRKLDASALRLFLWTLGTVYYLLQNAPRRRPTGVVLRGWHEARYK